ncbi:unnamed protein product [Brassica oleracea var. botrytis]
MNNLSEIEKNNELRNVGGWRRRRNERWASTGMAAYDKQKEKARVRRPSLILCHDAHQNDASAVRKLLEKDPSLVHARDYDNQTSRGQNGSHFEPKPLPPPIPKKCDWEIDPAELDFSNAAMIGKGSFGEIVKAYWRGTPVAVKRILYSLSDDRLVM